MRKALTGSDVETIDGQAMFDAMAAPPANWVEREPVVTSGAGWFQSADGADLIWTPGTYKEILFTVTGDNFWFWLGTADPTNGLWLPVNCPLRVAMPLDANDVFIKRAAGVEVTLSYVLIPFRGA